MIQSIASRAVALGAVLTLSFGVSSALAANSDYLSFDSASIGGRANLGVHWDKAGTTGTFLAIRVYDTARDGRRTIVEGARKRPNGTWPEPHDACVNTKGVGTSELCSYTGTNDTYAKAWRFRLCSQNGSDESTERCTAWKYAYK